MWKPWLSLDGSRWWAGEIFLQKGPSSQGWGWGTLDNVKRKRNQTAGGGEAKDERLMGRRTSGYQQCRNVEEANHYCKLTAPYLNGNHRTIASNRNGLFGRKKNHQTSGLLPDPIRPKSLVAARVLILERSICILKEDKGRERQVEDCCILALKCLPDLCFSQMWFWLMRERHSKTYFSTERGFECCEAPHGLVLNIQPAA